MSVKTNVQAVHDTLLEKFQHNEHLILLNKDINIQNKIFRISDKFIEEFDTDHIINTPITKSNIIKISIRTTIKKLKPITKIQFTNFHTPTFEQIVNKTTHIQYRSNNSFNIPIIIHIP